MKHANLIAYKNVYFFFRKEFRSEFEIEKPNFPPIKDESLKMDTNEEVAKFDDYLKMEVYEDKDYDIEEIKFWNFMSKNKSQTKPSIVKTSVYKVPESQYVVREVSVIVESEEKLKNIKGLKK
jgi:hypothetical protein